MPWLGRLEIGVKEGKNKSLLQWKQNRAFTSLKPFTVGKTPSTCLSTSPPAHRYLIRQPLLHSAAGFMLDVIKQFRGKIPYRRKLISF
jgi:hypothetical protein